MFVLLRLRLGVHVHQVMATDGLNGHAVISTAVIPHLLSFAVPRLCFIGAEVTFVRRVVWPMRAGQIHLCNDTLSMQEVI